MAIDEWELLFATKRKQVQILLGVSREFGGGAAEELPGSWIWKLAENGGPAAGSNLAAETRPMSGKAWGDRELPRKRRRKS